MPKAERTKTVDRQFQAKIASEVSDEKLNHSIEEWQEEATNPDNSPEDKQWIEDLLSIQRAEQARRRQSK